jgi:hypothetical protein
MPNLNATQRQQIIDTLQRLSPAWTLDSPRAQHNPLEFHRLVNSRRITVRDGKLSLEHADIVLREQRWYRVNGPLPSTYYVERHGTPAQLHIVDSNDLPNGDPDVPCFLLALQVVNLL